MLYLLLPAFARSSRQLHDTAPSTTPPVRLTTRRTTFFLPRRTSTHPPPHTLDFIPKATLSHLIIRQQPWTRQLVDMDAGWSCAAWRGYACRKAGYVAIIDGLSTAARIAALVAACPVAMHRCDACLPPTSISGMRSPAPPFVAAGGPRSRRRPRPRPRPTSVAEPTGCDLPSIEFPPPHPPRNLLLSSSQPRPHLPTSTPFAVASKRLVPR